MIYPTTMMTNLLIIVVIGIVHIIGPEQGFTVSVLRDSMHDYNIHGKRSSLGPRAYAEILTHPVSFY